MEVDSIGLAVTAVGGLIHSTKLDPFEVDGVILGNVVVNSGAPNLAREVILDLNLPKHIPGTTISIACLSGLEAVSLAQLSIETGNAKVIIAGGSDSLSSGELPMPRKFTRALGKYQMGGGSKKGWSGMKEIFDYAGYSPSNWLPVPNGINERSTGKSMGYHADMMAEINGVDRTEQDSFAIRSHRNAYHAREAGKLKQEIIPVITKGKSVAKDDLVRPDMDAARVAALPPAFRPRPVGTVSAATSSALTDGASAVLIMSAQRATELGYPADIVIRSYYKTAIEPFPQLLLAPAIAIPRALERAGLQLEDIDLFEIHEAFSAQVLATIKCLADPAFAKAYLGRSKAVGLIDINKVNVNGGSIAIGHPFAATGGRLVASLAAELRRTKKRFGLISICAAGGIGGVMILERLDSPASA